MMPLRALAWRASSFLLLSLAFAAPGVQAADATGCRYAKAVDLPIRYAGAGLVPAVDGTLNGTPATMLVDTGSDLTLLTSTAAIRRSLGLHWTMGRTYGIGGASRMYWARVKEIGIGDLHMTRSIDMPVIGDTAEAPSFDALIGAPFLLQMDLVMDLRAKKLAMYKPIDCDKTELFLWDENTIVVPFAPNWQRKINPHFTVLVNGKKLDAVIDSGAHRSFMTLAAAERAGVDVKAPGVVRLGDSHGVGAERAPHWSAPIQTFEIANEKISNAELGVIDARSQLDAEVYLGQDFLRAHRVLFAMKQEKLYIAYLGGDAFTRGTGVEPWMQQEAEAGNADAQYALAARLTGQEARAWLDKAAGAGQPNARLRVARTLMDKGQFADAVPLLRAAIDQLPGDRHGPLWLYIARLRTGDADLARRELQASLDAQDRDDWPYPVARLYLGKLDPAGVLDAAGKGLRPACMAEEYIAEWHAARGEDAEAKSMMASVRAHCRQAVAVQDNGQRNAPADP